MARDHTPHERISGLQLAVTVASGFTALGLFEFPRDLIIAAGRQAYWAFFLAVILGAASMILVVQLGLRFPRQTIVQYAQTVLGAPLGKLVALFLIFFHACLAAVTLRHFGDLVNTVFLARTPPEFTMLALTMAVVYINWHGLESMTRFVFLFYPVMVVVVVATFLLVFSRSGQLVSAAILPPLDFDPVAVLAGAWRIMYLFVGLEAVTMLLPFVRRPTSPYRYALTAVGINSALVLIVLMTTLGTWGTSPTERLEYPGVAVLRVLRFPGLLIERLGGFIALSWTMMGLTFLCIRFWTVPTATAQLVGLSHREFRYFLFPMALATYFLARWPMNHQEVEWWLQSFIVPLGVGANFGFALLLIVIATMRKVGKPE